MGDQPILVEENLDRGDLAGGEETNQVPDDLDDEGGTKNAAASSLANTPPAEADTQLSVLTSLFPASTENNNSFPPPALPPPSPPSTTVLKPSIFTMHSMSPPKD